MKIQGTTALVTGANRGIGHALVETLLDRGAGKVYAAARQLSSLDDVVALDPQRVVALELDVTKPEQVAAAAAKAEDVELLINNAGTMDFGGVLDADLDSLAGQLDVNLYGLLRVTRAFKPALAQAKGGVVNLLSVVALAPMPGIGHYSASKAIAYSVTESMRADFAKEGVSVHGVFPGPVDTDMAKDVPMDKTPPIDVARDILSGVEAGLTDIYPDPFAEQIQAGWASDPKAVAAQFAGA
ncbi:MAG: SDR family oxidoreductase [Planctomycetota bacterium]